MIPAGDNEAVEPLHHVSSITDDELLRRAVTSARAKTAGLMPRWVGVMHAFQLGSTFSRQLCIRFGLNPDEQVKRK